MKYKFAPAMIGERLSKHYDFFVDAAFVGKRLQKKTLSLLEIKDGDKFVDVGCATGTLAMLLKRQYPSCKVTGVDPGQSVLDVAKKKADTADLDIDFIQSGAEQLPFADESLDIVTSSLAFHHMPTDIKKQALAEIHRVLKDSSTFLLVDIGKPKNVVWRVILFLESFVEPREYIKDNLEGKIPGLISGAGFTVEEARKPYAGIRFWRCKKLSLAQS